MKYYLVAGEASGDLHGSNLMKGLLKADPQAEFRFFGGDLMEAVGGTLVKHYRDLAIMGVFAVLANLRTVARNLDQCKKDILDWKPDVVILIDFAGFNFKIAKHAHGKGLKVFYYISPKIWAWHKSRIKLVKAFVHRMFVIFPFEVGFYKGHGVSADFYGNPTIDALQDALSLPVNLPEFQKGNSLEPKPILALLAGSRKQEINLCLPAMIEAALRFPDYQPVIAGAPSIRPELYKAHVKDAKIPVLYGKTYTLLRHASAAIVVSGTATLETALLKVPEVVIYKAGTLTFIIGRPIIRIRFFSLVNLIMEKEVVKELLQFHLARDIEKEVDRLLNDLAYRNEMLAEYELLAEKLGKPGASFRFAEAITHYLKA
jgi:lipid-A-disaccharide synthase